MSRNSSTTSGISPLLVVWLFIVGLLVGRLIYSGIKSSRFEEAFLSGQVSLQSQFVPLNESSNPKFVSIGEIEIPKNGSTAVNKSIPRQHEVESGCTAFTLPQGTTGVWAATTFPNPELIEVHMPVDSVGTMLICSPAGATIELILWAEISTE